MGEKLYTMVDIARAGNISEGWVYKCMAAGRLPDCDFRTGNKRYWQDEGFRQAVAYFSNRVKWSREVNE